MQSQKGFTLIELSIAIIIIGLITGGVLGGRSLIESAKIQSTVQEFQKYKTAFNAYILEYDAMPGDHSEARSYFTTDKSGGASIHNGNGNNILNAHAEVREAFSHLVNAELVNSCICLGSELGRAVPDKMYPVAELGLPNLFLFWDYDANGGIGQYDDYRRGGTVLAIQGARWMGVSATYPDGYYHYTNWANSTNGPTTYKIDKKIDDGMPFKGMLTSANHVNCVATINDENSEYRKTPTERGYCAPALLIKQ